MIGNMLGRWGGVENCGLLIQRPNGGADKRSRVLRSAEDSRLEVVRPLVEKFEDTAAVPFSKEPTHIFCSCMRGGDFAKPGRLFYALGSRLREPQ